MSTSNDEVIDYERLRVAVIDVIDEKLHNNYDFDVIVRNSSYCWDDTAIMVKARDFTMIFDVISYDLLQYEGMDVGTF